MVKKTIFLLVSILLVSILYYKINTKEYYDIPNKIKYKKLYNLAKSGDIKAIDKMYKYFFYSKKDYNKTIEILTIGAKHNDKISQYRLSLFFIRHYYPYIDFNKKERFKNEGLFWLKKSALQGYEPAIKELKRLKIDINNNLKKNINSVKVSNY